VHAGDELHGVQYGLGWDDGYGEGGTQGERERDAVLTAILQVSLVGSGEAR
jgi:hypothetical protein